MEQSRIDFNVSITAAPRGAYLCLALVIILFSLSLLYYGSLLSDAALTRAQSTAVSERGSNEHATSGDVKQAELYARRWQAAQNVVARLNVPWSSLFAALEQAAGADIALLSVEPDSARHEVHVTVESDSIAAAVAYATRLQSDGALTNVYLASQRPSHASPARRLQVVIAGRWISIELPHHAGPDVAPLHASVGK